VRVVDATTERQSRRPPEHKDEDVEQRERHRAAVRVAARDADGTPCLADEMDDGCEAADQEQAGVHSPHLSLPVQTLFSGFLSISTIKAHSWLTCNTSNIPFYLDITRVTTKQELSDLENLHMHPGIDIAESSYV
jgi:hypothetical protein